MLTRRRFLGLPLTALLVVATQAGAANRKGSRRVGGTGSSGKGSRYRGGSSGGKSRR